MKQIMIRLATCKNILLMLLLSYSVAITIVHVRVIEAYQDVIHTLGEQLKDISKDTAIRNSRPDIRALEQQKRESLEELAAIRGSIDE